MSGEGVEVDDDEDRNEALAIALYGLRAVGHVVNRIVVPPELVDRVGPFCLEHGLELVVDPERPIEMGAGLRW